MFRPAFDWKTLFAASLTFALNAFVVAADWPTFRGADRTGVAPDTGLLSEWPAEGPSLVLEFKGAGRGYGSPSISGNYLVTLGDGLSTAEDKDEYLAAFDLKSGKQLWKTKTGEPWTDGRQEAWKSSRSTPTIDGERVYAITPFGKLLCCELATEEEIWSKDLKTDFGGKKGDDWGYSESVTIDAEKLLCTPGGEKSTMIALNKTTGEPIWTAVREGDKGAGHSSIVKSEVGGTKVYIQNTASGTMGVRANDGKVLWTFDIKDTTAVIPTTIVRGDLVYFVAGYGSGGALLKQIPAEQGEVKIEVLYPLIPKIGNKHGGVVLVGDYLYGDSEDKGTPLCVDLMTGEIKWPQRRNSKGKDSTAVLAADGHLYLLFSNGVMALAKATPDGYEELGSFELPESGDRPCWAHPVIADGKALCARPG